jgi:uncharacterized membrane protein
MKNPQPGNQSTAKSTPPNTPSLVNPRRGALIYGLAMLVSLIGLGDSIYLTTQHLSGKSVKCTVTHGCSAVLGSAYSTIAGIPTAAFGALAYFSAFSLATLALFGYAGARAGLAVVATLMFLMTLWLFYVQAFILHAYCEYCLLSAAMTTTLMVLVVVARFFLPARASGDQ